MPLAPTNTPHARWTRALRRPAAGAAMLVASIHPAAAQPDVLGGPMFALDDGPEVVISAQARAGTVAPGEQTVVAVILDHKPGWHTNLNEPVIPEAFGDFPAAATTVTPSAGDRGDLVTFGPPQWPEPYAEIVSFTGEPVEFLVYSGLAPIYVPIVIDERAAPGQALVLSFEVFYQSCNDRLCLAPTAETVEVELTVVTPEERAAADDGAEAAEVFADFDPVVFADPDAWGDAFATDAGAGGQDQARSFFGIALPAIDGPVGIGVMALLAVLGGMILNLTPCVLPVIPIKIMSLSQHAATPGRSLVLGLWMAAGVVGFWLALGVIAVSVTSLADPSRLFGIWYVTVAIGVAIAAFGVGIMGAFNISLPQWVYRINPSAESAHGSFLFGVMTAVLGLPCFGFVAGALLAGSATMPAAVVMTVFAAIGIGMAAPYLVLAARPGLLERMPRTGPASELVKQVMGLLMLAAACYFLGAGVLALIKSDPARVAALPWWAKTAHWWFIGLFAVAAAVWMFWQTVRITRSAGRRAAIALASVVIATGGVAAGADQTLRAYHDFWVPYTPETLASALEEDGVVVLDFTADWCLNCKALEAAVLAPQPVRGELLSSGVVPLKADLTSTKAPGWDKLRALGQTGIPLLAIYGPGLETPWLANAYTPAQVMDAIARARGATEAAGLADSESAAMP